MAIYIKNPEIKKKVFRSINRYDNLSIKAYRKGDMKTGLKYETKSDQLYKNNYNKIFGIKQ